MKSLSAEQKSQVCFLVAIMYNYHNGCSVSICGLSFLQLTLKSAASDMFKDKKACYPDSVPRPFLTTHLCENTLKEYY